MKILTLFSIIIADCYSFEINCNIENRPKLELCTKTKAVSLSSNYRGFCRKLVIKNIDKMQNVEYSEGSCGNLVKYKAKCKIKKR